MEKERFRKHYRKFIALVTTRIKDTKNRKRKWRKMKTKENVSRLLRKAQICEMIIYLAAFQFRVEAGHLTLITFKGINKTKKLPHSNE
jgi:hypothetical protein